MDQPQKGIFELFLSFEATLKTALQCISHFLHFRMLQGAHSEDADGGPEFAEVFVIIWLGASVVTLNSKLLGGTM